MRPGWFLCLLKQIYKEYEKMKKTKLLMVVLMMVSLVFLGGCEMIMGLFGVPVTAEARIGFLEDDLDNANWLLIYKNFHPDNTVEYNDIKISTFWTARYENDYSYKFENINVSSSSATATLVGTTSSGTTAFSRDVSFTFAEIDEDSYIVSYVDGALDVHSIFPAR